MHEKRKHSRIDINTEVRVTHPSFGSVTLLTRDMSDSGLFLITKDVAMPPIGTVLEIQALAFGESAPILKAIIKRSTPKGVGIMFCQEEEEEEEEKETAS